jgi:hypothetical protein
MAKKIFQKTAFWSQLRLVTLHMCLDQCGGHAMEKIVCDLGTRRGVRDKFKHASVQSSGPDHGFLFTVRTGCTLNSKRGETYEFIANASRSLRRVDAPELQRPFSGERARTNRGQESFDGRRHHSQSDMVSVPALFSLIAALEKSSFHYEQIHCLFCRGGLGDPNSGVLGLLENQV